MLSLLVQEYTIHIFKRGGVVPKGDQSCERGQQDPGVEKVDLLTDRVWDAFRAGGSGGEGVSLSVHDFFALEEVR